MTLQVLVLLEVLLAVLYSPLYGALQSLGDIFCPNPFLSKEHLIGALDYILDEGNGEARAD